MEAIDAIDTDKLPPRDLEWEESLILLSEFRNVRTDFGNGISKAKRFPLHAM